MPDGDIEHVMLAFLLRLDYEARRPFHPRLFGQDFVQAGTDLLVGPVQSQRFRKPLEAGRSRGGQHSRRLFRQCSDAHLH